MFKKIILPFVFLVLLVGSWIIYDHNKIPHNPDPENDISHIAGEARDERKYTRLKTKAAESIRWEEKLSKHSSSGAEIKEVIIPAEVPEKCRKPDVLKEILEASGESLVENALNYSKETQACLAVLGSPTECFSNSPGADEDKSCLNNLLIARATLIDKLSAGKPFESLDVSVIANKIVAKIYESPDSVERNGTEIFALSDEVLKVDPENQEAHNLRAISGVAALKQNFDRKTLSKARESASLMENFSDPNFLKRSIWSRFAYSIMDFLVSKDSSSLDFANLLADEFISKYANRPEGYHMKATVEGLRNNLDMCKHFTKKGLNVGGPSQPGYQEYVELVKSIEAGSIKKELLGVRYDVSEVFRPDELLK